MKKLGIRTEKQRDKMSSFEEWCKQNNKIELLSEWDFEKNKSIAPDTITTGTKKKIWWKCLDGHHWQALISNRMKGTGCPFCSGRVAISGENDIVTLFPEIAKEWDFEANGDIKPEDYLPHSEKKVWWKGSCGHKWQAAICDRVKGGKCVYCLGKRVLKGFNDLETVNPRIASEWNYEKNTGLKTKAGEDISTPDKVTKSSSYKVWWKCKYGHEWMATVNKRDANRGCPYCGGRQTSLPEQALVYYLTPYFTVLNREKVGGYEVDVYLPEHNLGIEYDGWYYHKDKKKDLKKDRALSRLGIKLIRIKEAENNYIEGKFHIFFNRSQMTEGFRWACDALFDIIIELTGRSEIRNIDIDLKRDDVYIRERFDLILKENNLLTGYPEIAEEWDYDKNGILKPDMFEKSSNQSVWWKCKKGHQWKSTINNRTGINKNKCPYCSNKKVLTGFNDLATIFPSIAKEWDYEKNGDLKPTHVLPKINKKVWWKCSKGHSYETMINTRTTGNTGCPYCSGREVVTGKSDLMTLFPNIATEWNYEKNGDLRPENVTAYSHKKVWWKCSKGHEWESIISNRTGLNKNGCPYCGQRVAKPIVCVETGKQYLSAGEAQRLTGIKHIGDCAKGKRNLAGGCHWKYVE